MSALSVIQQIFPTPKYISFPTVGVDISDTSLKYIQFERLHARDTNLLLKQWGDIDVPAGIVERGNVHDVKQLSSILKEVKEKCDAQFVSISLPEERAFLFETTIPRSTPIKEIRSMLEFKLEENVPLSPRDAYFDYAIVGQDTQCTNFQVAVAVYAQDTINMYYEACVNAGVTPLAFEIEAQAIARASIPVHEPGTHFIVDFGKTRMGIGIVHEGVLMYTSTIDISGLHLSAEMKRILGDIPESELTEIKNTKGLIPTQGNEAIAEALKGVVKNIVNELSIRMHYWHTRDIDRGKREVQKIILCGGSANLLGLPEFLAQELNIPTERALVWQNAFSLEAYVPQITRKYSYGYATAVGLALRNLVQ